MYNYAGWYRAQNFGLDANLPTSIINAADTTETARRNQYQQIAAQTAVSINGVVGFSFVPVLATKYFDAGIHNDMIMDRGATLNLTGYPLLSLTSVVLGDGVSLAVGTNVTTHPKGITPYTALHISSGAGSWYQYTDTYKDAIAITGVWGYRSDYTSSGFILSGDAVGNATQISSSGTSLTVTDTNGQDSNFYAPRFDIGQVIRIESEYCIVAGVDYTTNILTIMRGQLGTTAVAHANATAIYTWQVEPDVSEAASLIADYVIFRRNNFSTLTRSEAGYSITQFPEIWPERATIILSKYIPTHIRSV